MRRPAQWALDVLILALAFGLAYLLRFDFVIPAHQFRPALVQLPLVILIQLAALVIYGIHNFIWRYVGLAESKSFAAAALVSALPLILLRLLLPEPLRELRVPLSIICMDTFLAFGGLLGMRVVRRILYERFERNRQAAARGAGRLKAVLLVGAGRAGVLAAKEILGRGDLDLEIHGFVDDELSKQGLVIQGIKVLGRTEDLPRLVRELHIDHVVITIAQASRARLRRIVDICERIPVRARIIPGLYEILEGKVQVSHIRDVQIEDLLGRDPVQLEEQTVRRFIQDQTILITGAGGSIGSELGRQVARCRPARLLLVERAEFALFEADRKLRELQPGLDIVPLVADVGDEERMRSILSNYRPQVILHAAAHKHVPLMESNAVEAIKNNVLATDSLGVLAGETEVGTFVLISTDKAVRPTSVMGASKRVAELIVQDLDRRFATRYVAVRFGNVLESAGSVIPIFREQILKGGPVTVTHPDMVRYFMTISEATQLVLQAGAMGAGGEIFILDMGEPVRIVDLARDMIHLYSPGHEEIEIVFTGVRPGEKLSEELGTQDEPMAKTRHPKILIGRIAPYPPADIAQALERMAYFSFAGDERALLKLIGDLLPEAELRAEGGAATACASPAANLPPINRSVS